MKRYLYNLATDKEKGFFAFLAKLLLLLASFIYGLLIRGLILFFSFKPARLNCRIISIGNITLGGTGKTSLVEFISHYLRDKGHRIAVLSRGYKKIDGEIGDEPAMLLKHLGDIPVIVDKDRVRAAKRAIKEYGVDTVILDDGLQQWRLKKDLEIVTVSAAQGLGNRHMLPRGILREPLCALRRADIFVLTKTGFTGDLKVIKSDLNKINPTAQILESTHVPLGFYAIDKPEELWKPDYLKAKPVALFSGIGEPEAFSGLMRSLHVRIGLELRFSDHHNYSAEELADICAKAGKAGLGIIVTTVKDASRLSDADIGIFKKYKLLVLRIALKITKNEGQLITRLLSLYSL
ncbi:MAG: tetraacyldisaccharide 4'-kinase [Candidatus Omnitrophica bacterium]|nr:tetraacyldisaccharide 4'-kinase [Candidatus Omnitrophota bacterium]MDD5662357.1 tetraacyldisaccharide 4'-kinase [Candidatus Omnitrophota bacterium]